MARAIVNHPDFPNMKYEVLSAKPRDDGKGGTELVLMLRPVNAPKHRPRAMIEVSTFVELQYEVREAL